MAKKPNRNNNHNAQPVRVSYATGAVAGQVSNELANTVVILGSNEQVSFEPSNATARYWEPGIARPGIDESSLKFPVQQTGTPKYFGDTSELDTVEQSPRGSEATEGDASDQDDTGIDPPDTELADIVPLGSSLPTPGTHTLNLTKMTVDPDDARLDESPPGPTATFDLPSGKYPRIKPPKDYRNWLANPEVAARGNDAAATPEGWQRETGLENVLITDPLSGVQVITDTTVSTDDEPDVIVTPPIDLLTLLSPATLLQNLQILTNRVMVDIPEPTYLGGAVQVDLIQTLINDDAIRTPIATLESADLHDIVLRTAAPTSEHVDDADVVLDEDASFMQFAFSLIGSSDAGARLLDVGLFNFGSVLGQAIPLKRIEDREVLVPPAPVSDALEDYFLSGMTEEAAALVEFPAMPGLPTWPFPLPGDLFPPTTPPVATPPVEEPSAPYPTFGYTTVVFNPPDSQRAVLSPASGPDPITYVPGNIVEYYGPPGMPVTSTFFMSGMKVPVKQEERLTLSFHFFWRGVTQPATPLKALLKNRLGQVIADLGTFEDMEGVTGDSANQVDADENGYVRRSLTVIVPLGNTLLVNPLEDLTNGAAYIELVSGGCGGGLFRVMGGQNESGEVMTSFSTDHALSGSITTTFDMGVPGVPQGAMPQHAKVKWYVDMDAEVTNVEYDGGSLTGYTVEAQVKTYESSTYTTLTGDLETLEIPSDTGYHLRLKTTLTTEHIYVTPRMHSHFLDFERDNEWGPGFGSLCRADGTEFDGTVTLYNFPPIREIEPISQEEYADHTHGFGVMGKSASWATGFGIECYLDSTAEEIMFLIGKALTDADTFSDDSDASVFVAEIMDMRHRLRILEMDIQPVDRMGYVPLTANSSDGVWLLQAEDISGRVLDQAVF